MARCSRAGDRQPLTMRMASCTSRGSSGCIRAIDSFTGRAELHRPLEQQPGHAGLFVPGERVEPAEFGYRPADRILVGADDLAAGRGARDRPRGDGGVPGVVGEEGQPGQVDARVADRPDLPVDDRVDPVAFAQGVPEPEVAVVDRRPERRGHARPQRLGGPLVVARHVLRQGGERAGPPVHLVGEPDGGLVAKPDRGRDDPCNRASTCTASKKPGPHLAGRGPLGVIAQHRFHAVPRDQVHRHERRDLRRLARVGEEHVRRQRTGGPLPPGPPSAASPGAARHGCGPGPARAAPP